jgi:hypothetical protein
LLINNHTFKKGMRILDKKLLSSISGIYVVLVIGGFFTWAFSVRQPDGTIDILKYMDIVLIFLGLIFIGVILAGISLAAVNEKSSKIGKKTIISGLAIALVFLVWRVMMGIF